ncbi:PepSY domain-containing protein [Rhodoferax sp.]|uniref:PepSY domain-containing protein n=1 Tax=Rhodoferax sp. TaxID=50421 RepID=UPI002621C8EE|nr:PepSY domain-containing protein [Rhodoferax sp.]MDD2808920.1 PepSY domain-containing protein [Rhodoferax sp.]
MTPEPLSRPTHRFVRLLCAAVLLMASGHGHTDSDHDHDRARQALEAGEVLPLHKILERVHKEVPGEVLDVELDRDNDHGAVSWTYKIKVLRQGGDRVKLKIDARTGRLISRKTKD